MPRRRPRRSLGAAGSGLVSKCLLFACRPSDADEDPSVLDWNDDPFPPSSITLIILCVEPSERCLIGAALAFVNSGSLCL